MSEALRPWIREYFESYVSRYDDLGKIHMKRGKVQILSFLSFPKTDEEFLWASVSDKEYIIPARFTLHAMKTYNDNPENESRPLTSRRSAVSRINCKQILRCKPPLGAQKGLNPSWQLAFEIDEVEVIGCEGEPQFGTPREFNEESRVQIFLRGLAEGRGNVLRKLSDKGPSKGLDNAMILRRNGSALSNDSGRSRGSSIQTDPGFEIRYKKWQHEMESLGLIHCYEHPEVDSERLEFKNDTLDEPHPPHPPLLEPESVPRTPARTFTPINRHTTPSQWSPSAAACSSPPNLTDNERILSSASSPSSSRPASDYQNGSEDESHPVIVDESPQLNRHATHGATILVPDSDISHSQPQSLQVQKPDEPYSLTMFSVPETNYDYHQKFSQLNDEDRVTASPGAAAGKTSSPDPISDHGSLFEPPGRRKRKYAAIESEQSSQDPVDFSEQPAESRKPLHDPSIWKKPSFMASPIQRDVDIGTQDRNNDGPEKLAGWKQTPKTNEVNNAVNLKLGGWKPDWALESISGVMTHEKLKALLSDVIRKREGLP